MKNKIFWGFIILAGVYFVITRFTGNSYGTEIGIEFVKSLFIMLKILPFAFVLIALFEVWCKRETVEKHLGQNCGYKGYLWALLLGGITIGGLFVAFPLAYSLHKKGASLKVIFSFLGFAGVCRIPMTLFEASFLGIKFTIIRITTAIIVMLISGILLGNYLEKRDYSINE